MKCMFLVASLVWPVVAVTFLLIACACVAWCEGSLPAPWVLNGKFHWAIRGSVSVGFTVWVFWSIVFQVQLLFAWSEQK